jgi:hypothetical protein
MTTILSSLIIVAILVLAVPAWLYLRDKSRELRSDIADIAKNAREQSRKAKPLPREYSQTDPWAELEQTLDEANSNPLADKKALEQEIEELTRGEQP